MSASDAAGLAGLERERRLIRFLLTALGSVLFGEQFRGNLGEFGVAVVCIAIGVGELERLDELVNVLWRVKP